MSSHNPFQAEAVQNYAQKCCVALVLDTSSSMAGPSIDQLNQGIQSFFQEIAADPANNSQQGVRPPYGGLTPCSGAGGLTLHR